MNNTSPPQPGSPKPTDMDSPRTEFLLEMYRQTSNHLNRHILLVWQSAALLGGAYAAFAFQDKQVISIHVAAGIALLLCGWFCANVYDAYAWFDRNLVIITNIETLFLTKEDAKYVHPYFPGHRSAENLVLHFRIQLFLGVAVAVMVVAVHLYNQVLPSFKIPNGVFSWNLAFPYLVLASSIVFCGFVRHQVYQKAQKLRVDAPGLR
jgi:hypothetical protein